MSQTPPPPPPPPGGTSPPPPGGMPPPPPPQPPYGGTPAGFSVGNAFNYGWTKFQANIGPLLLVMVGFFVVGAIIYAIFYVASGAMVVGTAPTCEYKVLADGSLDYVCTGGGGLGFMTAGFFLIYGIQSIVLFLYGYLVQSAFTRASLAVTDGRPVDAKTVLSSERLGQILVGGVIMAVATTIGYFLCIIPGVIIAFFGHYFVFFVVDKGMSGFDAIKASFQFVNKNLGSLIGLFLAEVLALIIGALICGIGLIVAVPIVIIAQAFAYRKLQGQEVVA